LILQSGLILLLCGYFKARNESDALLLLPVYVMGQMMLWQLGGAAGIHPPERHPVLIWRCQEMENLPSPLII